MRKRSRQETPAPFLIGVQEAQRLTSLGRSTIYELMDLGDIDSVKVGKRRLISYDSLKAWAAGLPRENLA